MHNHLFDPSVYVERRKQLAKTVGEGVVLLLGNEDSSMNYADNCYPFRQDSSFLYYAGLDLPGLVLIIDCSTGEEVLFGKEAGIDDIIWTGPLLSLAALAQLTGIHTTKPYDKIESFLTKAKASHPAIHYLPPYRPENKIKLSGWLQMPVAAVGSLASIKLTKAVIAQRQIKEAVEIAEIEKAVNTSVDMHTLAMQYAQPGMKEYEVAAKVEEIALAANGRLSYPIILTVNGETLHNHYHGNTIAEGNLVLVDAGAETAMHYAGDLTRTFPVSKTFSQQQREVYDAVLHSLQHAASLLKPGISFMQVHEDASVKLLEGLKAIGLVKGEPAEAVKEGVHTLFFQCGLGHMMGLDVHDMEDLGEPYVGYTETLIKRTDFGWKSLRLGKALQPGFVLTVEPGVYFIPELIDRWKAANTLPDFINYEKLEAYRNFGGIRIEDNFLITPEGSRKLGKYLATTANEVEALRKF